MKGSLFIVWESAKTEGGKASSGVTPAVNEQKTQLKFFVALYRSVDDCESIMNIDFGVTNFRQ